MATELKLVQPERTVVLIHSRSQLLSSEPFPDEVKDYALSLTHEAGVQTIMGVRVTRVLENQGSVPGSTQFKLSLSDGRQLTAGFVINAVSKFVPTSSYLPVNVLDEEGYVKIKPRYFIIHVNSNCFHNLYLGTLLTEYQ